MINEAEVNAFAAKQARKLRTSAGVSQTAVGRELGVSMQQVQKYEWNINRMSVGRCMQFAEAFDVSVLVFFPDRDRHYSDGEVPPPTLRFVRLLNKINPKHYDLVYEALKTIAKLSGSKAE
jgi:transcriptional regulator with XRE-family HTH domain